MGKAEDVEDSEKEITTLRRNVTARYEVCGQSVDKQMREGNGDMGRNNGTKNE
jgi:hypothetical protein